MKTQDRYVKFMGSWMAGTLIGHYLANVAIFFFVVWVIYRLFIK